jgi:four helix bundle protein
VARSYRFRFKTLDVYRLAVEHFHWTCAVVDRMPKGPWEVTRQAVSAALSIMGNVGEANGRGPKAGEVRQHYRYAQGSTYEAATHLDAFAALKVIDDDEYNAAEHRLQRIAAMLTSGMKRQRRQPAAARRRPPAQRALRASEASPGARPPERGPGASGASHRDRPPAQPGRHSERSEPGDRPPAQPGPRASEASERDRPSTFDTP